ncbi:hypothetical protein ACVR1G_05320 [Streptococcus dentasini]
MALTDENMQDLQGVTQDWCELSKGARRKVGGQEYEIVNTSTGTTQAVAVAPVNKDGSVDYEQTSIAVYGTQPGINDSTGNAIQAFGGMTPQYDDVEKFYNETEKKVDNHGGEITNMSGYSQSGPAVAKVAADHKVDKVTNFADWGAQAAYDNGDITEEDKRYLDKHATIYTDSGKDLTWLNKGGKIPYGKKVVVEGKHDLNPISDHDFAYAHIKGNGPDVNWYVKHHQFCSGMTKEQAKKVAKYQAKHDHNPFKSTQDYLDEYNDTYGSFKKKRKVKAKKSKANQNLSVDKSKMKNASVSVLTKRLASVSGSEKILLKKELLTSLASEIKEDVQAQKKKVTKKQEEAKEKIEKIIERTRTQALEIAKTLPAGEVEALLSELSLGQVWQSGVEAENETQAHQFASKVTQLSENLTTAADRIEETDREDAQQIKLL